MVSFAAEPIFFIGNFPVTNSLLHTFFIDALLIVGMYFLNKSVSMVPSVFQNAAELVFDGFYDLTRSISPHNVKKIFPYFMGFFLFILIGNWTSLLPGVGTVGLFHGKEFIPFLRGATSDINTTIGLALVSAVSTHILSIQMLGVKEYLGRYFSINPLYLFIGMLELVGEVTKVISLSFRLFGNIFAGEVVISTISGIFPFAAFIVPLPFLALEVIVGLVQALVFSMLTMTFMAILMTSHHAEEEGGEIA